MTRLRFTESTSARIVATIRDRQGDLVPPSDLIAATLTLWDLDTGTVLNSRSHQDILGGGSPPEENGVTMYEELQTDPDGTQYNLQWLLDPADNDIITERRQIERHRALFHFESATDTMNIELELDVENLRRVIHGSPE